ncbi:MAG: methionine adenosyltransferase [Rickettsiales bacterium]|jgi:S-adenosylmethionine synthetase|nr:methionine adenosyltransferase [Rickettsiales bacterium]
MINGNCLFTSESVSAGHPDKVCDQISDAVLDAHLRLDSNAKVACETFATTNKVIIGGEVRTTNGSSLLKDDIDKIVRDVVKDIGYDQKGFSWKTIDIEYLMHSQSDDIAQGVDVNKTDEGAGDQGIMFGYANTETEDYLPAAIYYSHRILQNLSNEQISDLLPDAKSQVTLKYENGKAIKAEKVLVSTQHKEHLTQDDVRRLVIPIIEKTLPNGWMPSNENIYINPTGRFVIGGPDGDTGLTGRKIIVDTYGGYAPHGGGAFSGKDPTKVDRSAAYIARYLAKNVVANGIAEQCLIQIGYAIGISNPLSFYINTFGAQSNEKEDKLGKRLQELVDLRPKGIRERLQLNKPIYKKTATFGHFGRKADGDYFTWEKVDLEI